MVKDDELNINLYEGQPLVYTNINDQPSDICINFPFAEITYKGSFSKYIDQQLHEHLFPRKILVGGQLFIKNLNSITPTDIDILQFHLTWIYNLAKYNIENPFNNLVTLNVLPKIETSDGEKLNNIEKIANWMNDLYQKKNMFDIISYEDLILISKLRKDKLPVQDIQPGIANFEKKLSLEEWVEHSIHVNLARWINDFHFLHGLIINKYNEMEISKKVGVKFIKIPKVNLCDKSYVKMINPTSTIEECLIFNNISVKDIKSFPFINRTIKSDDSYGDYHFSVRLEKYEILIDHIKPTMEFERAIEVALKSSKPFKALLNIFDKYGYLFSQRIVLGISLKINLPNTSNISEKQIDLKKPIFKSLRPYLDDLNVSYLLTKKGVIIDKENDLPNWIQDTNNDLEIIEFDKVISLYEILEAEQKRKIDIILNNQDNFKIIMTGIADLQDLDRDNTVHYKRINIELSLEDENYEVFGSIISKNGSKLVKEYIVNFGLYDSNGFYAMILSNIIETIYGSNSGTDTIEILHNPNSEIDILECEVLWMIVGNPSKLSVFSPKNREFQVHVECTSVTIDSSRRGEFIINPPFKLYQGYTIFINAYHPQENHKLTRVEIEKWSEYNIVFRVQFLNNSNLNDTIVSDICLNICILRSDYRDLKIDNRNEFSLNFGDMLTLTKENYNDDLLLLFGQF